MTEHFNNLAPAEAERLAMLAEECAEVIQIISKIQRHGYESYHPGDPLKTTNRAMLRKEVTDIAAVTASMLSRNDFEAFTDMDVKVAWRKKLRYSHHQEQQP